MNAFHFLLLCFSRKRNPDVDVDEWKIVLSSVVWGCVLVIRSLAVQLFIIWLWGQCYPNKTQSFLSFHLNEWIRRHRRNQTVRNDHWKKNWKKTLTIFPSPTKSNQLIFTNNARQEIFQYKASYPSMIFLLISSYFVMLEKRRKTEFGRELKKSTWIFNIWNAHGLWYTLQTLKYLNCTNIAWIYDLCIPYSISLQNQTLYTFECNMKIQIVYNTGYRLYY